jgi:hypothetical protein
MTYSNLGGDFMNCEILPLAGQARPLWNMLSDNDRDCGVERKSIFDMFILKIQLGTIKKSENSKSPKPTLVPVKA